MTVSTNKRDSSAALLFYLVFTLFSSMVHAYFLKSGKYIKIKGGLKITEPHLKGIIHMLVYFLPVFFFPLVHGLIGNMTR